MGSHILELTCSGHKVQREKKHISVLCSDGLEMRLRIRIPWLLLMHCNLQQVIKFLFSFSLFGYKLEEHTFVILDIDTQGLRTQYLKYITKSVEAWSCIWFHTEEEWY